MNFYFSLGPFFCHEWDILVHLHHLPCFTYFFVSISDENFTSYSELLDAVGNSSIKYGLIDSQVAKVWTPQLIKEKINVKRKIKLDGSLGVFAAGSARQLHVCFETYMKEEASKILTAMQITLQVLLIPQWLYILPAIFGILLFLRRHTLYVKITYRFKYFFKILLFGTCNWIVFVGRNC